MQASNVWLRWVASPPPSDEQTLGSMSDLTQLRRLSLHFAEGIGNAEMRALRLPTSLEVHAHVLVRECGSRLLHA